MMNTDALLEMGMYTLPALITGGVAYVFLQKFMANEEQKQRYRLLHENRKQTLPIKLQAYERMALFLERIQLNKLVVRVAPLGNQAPDYMNLLLHTIEQEFEHNLTQQIYISGECWVMIIKAKSAVMQQIRAVQSTLEAPEADAFREQLLKQTFDQDAPTVMALDFLKSEVAEFL
jgi:hypothetical protein